MRNAWFKVTNEQTAHDLELDVIHQAAARVKSNNKLQINAKKKKTVIILLM